MKVSMTSEPLYKILFDKKAEEYKDKHEVAYNVYTFPAATDDIEKLLSNKEVLLSNIGYRYILYPVNCMV